MKYINENEESDFGETTKIIIQVHARRKKREG